MAKREHSPRRKRDYEHDQQGRDHECNQGQDPNSDCGAERSSDARRTSSPVSVGEDSTRLLQDGSSSSSTKTVEKLPVQPSSHEDCAEFKVSLKKISGAGLELTGLSPQMKVIDMKRKAEQSLGVPPKRQKLVLSSDVLDDEKMLSDSGVENGSSLMLVVAPSDDFYVRLFMGSRGCFEEYFFGCRTPGSNCLRFRVAKNSSEPGDIIVRKEAHLSQATMDVLQTLITESEILEELDMEWPAAKARGRNVELEVICGEQHISFQTQQWLSLSDIHASRDPEGLRVLYYLVEDIKAFIASICRLHFSKGALSCDGRRANGWVPRS